MNIKQILISGIIMLALDGVYLTTTSGYFSKVVQKVQGSKLQFNILGAFACYFLLIYGVNHFIIDQRKSLIEAFILGIVIYGVYETTTYTILKDWPMGAVIMDTTWGGILFVLTNYLTKKMIQL